ncbi:MAG TPA: hypothetical protein EYG03_17960 [Planctomycetes bacterium]|nr:hypothetical protein [Planctomycetota bacterium]
MQELKCELCGVSTPRRGPVQRYCPECSTKRDLERKRLWARKHGSSETGKVRSRVLGQRNRELAREAGQEINRRVKKSISWDGVATPDLVWQVGIAVPFSYAASKNHIYAMRRQGHVALRRESRAIRDSITFRLQEALEDVCVAHNKLWLDILVQKPNHRGDAVNVVDLVCDAVKDAVTVDDRWFCIRRLDWEIVRENPQLYLKVGQETNCDAQVCSYCGRIKELKHFNKCKASPLGVGRECRQCRREGRRKRKGNDQ